MGISIDFANNVGRKKLEGEGVVPSGLVKDTFSVGTTLTIIYAITTAADSFHAT